MPKDKYICNFLLFLFIVYFSQGIIYPSGGNISRYSLVVLMTISLLYFIKELYFEKNKNTLFVKVWTALLLLNIVGFILKGDFDSVSNLRSILLNMLPFYAFYYFSKKGVLTKDHLIIVLLILAPIFIYKFTISFTELQILKNREEVVVNTVYLFMGLIPFAFLFKRKLFSIVVLLIFWIIIVQSAKRAAIISEVIAILLFFYYLFMTANKRNQIRNYAIVLILIFGISYWGSQYLKDHDYLMMRLLAMIEGDTSGRDILSRSVFESWYESNDFFKYVFGNGFATTADVSISVSHNDWLELLASFGILGFGIYGMLFYSATKEILYGEWVFKKKIIFMCIIGIALIASVTSRWYGSSFAYSQALLLPYLLATKNKD